MIDFAFEVRHQFLTDMEGWFSTGDYVCGKATLELSVSASEEEGVPESANKVFGEFLQDIDNVADKIKEEILERYERLSRLGMYPYDKLVKQISAIVRS